MGNKVFFIQHLVVFLMLFSSIDLAFGGEKEVWSFEEHPQPSLSEMSPDEQLALLSAKKRTNHFETSCRLSLDVEYQIYLDRYPNYFAAYDERERFRLWKRHIALNDNVQDLTCLYDVLVSDIGRFNQSDAIDEDFVFCGNYSRAPRSSAEIRMKTVIDELMEYANFGTTRAIDALTAATGFLNIVNLSTEVSYYFTKFRQEILHTPLRETYLEDLKSFMSSEQTTLVDNAFEEKNYQAVVDALPKCEPVFSIPQ